MKHNIKLKTERMKGNGPGVAAQSGFGFQPNYLFGLDDLCKKFIQKSHTVLEIGSNRGISTELFCTYAKHVHAVDPSLTQRLKELIEKTDNLTYSQCSSEQFSKACDKKYDLIYIDAQHGYAPVVQDIKLSLPLLKDDGILAGHDMISELGGVLEAVNKSFPKIKDGSIILHRFSDSSWALSAKDIEALDD